MKPTADDPGDTHNVGDEGPGLPLLRSWRSLYIFVAVVFAGWVAVLYALTRAFS